ncbi:hypothetical protein HQ584_02705 [Patescibacteria group bacterium]|nr:hypothetical protein [Patescibacteria group bacterium]
MAKYKFSDVEEYFLKKRDVLKELLATGKKFEAALLALCYIDALGNLFLEGNTGKNRFLNLLFSYGTVDTFRWDKVNLAEFKKVEKNVSLACNICPTCYEKVKLYVEQRICEYDYSYSSKCLEKDKNLSEVIRDIIEISREKVCKCNVISEPLLRCLYDATYGGILYKKYRCESVHEAKFSELWSSIGEHFEEPFYMDIDGELPHFSITPEFIIETLDQCLINLQRKK